MKFLAEYVWMPPPISRMLLIRMVRTNPYSNRAAAEQCIDLWSVASSHNLRTAEGPTLPYLTFVILNWSASVLMMLRQMRQVVVDASYIQQQWHNQQSQWDADIVKNNTILIQVLYKLLY